MAQAVQFARRDAHLDEGGDVVEYFGAELAGYAHAFDVGGGIDTDGGHDVIRNLQDIRVKSTDESC